MFPLNAVAPLNALPMFVTFATFQEFKSWLNEVAFWKVPVQVNDFADIPRPDVLVER